MNSDPIAPLCECGCGEPAGVYATTAHGHRKGDPRRFIHGHNQSGKRHLFTLQERFWAKVEVRGPNDCWEWRARVEENGYGMIGVHGRYRQGAHRVAWMLEHGHIPADLCILHHCDNRKCVNVAHLFLGTKADNARDMVRKGRHRLRRPTIGENVWTAKLTAEQALEIRSRFAAGETQVALGRIYGVDSSTVSALCRRQTWRHV